MKARTFHHRLDDVAVIEAIRNAESRTSGEVRVFVSGKSIKRNQAFAEGVRHFEKLGMGNTRQRNAVLLFLAPAIQEFAILADEGIRVGPAVWEAICEMLKVSLAKGEITSGVTDAIDAIGKVLEKEFPGGGDDPNELPNRIARD